MTNPWRVISLALLSLGAACVIALHVLRRDLDPNGHRISEYALGPYGSLMTIAFLSIGMGQLVLAMALGGAVDRSRWSAAASLAVASAGAGMIVAGIYRTDPERSGATADAIHSAASAGATVALIASALALSIVRYRVPCRVPCRRSPAWRPDLTAALAIMAGVLGALSPLLHRSAWTGASQRLLWLTLLAWLVVTAWRLGPHHLARPSR